MAKQKTIDNKEIGIDIAKYRKEAKSFVETPLDNMEYTLYKKEMIVGEPITIFKMDKVVGDEGLYYNFKAFTDKDELICFNGGVILQSQLEENGLPARVKLERVDRPNNKLKPYYWTFKSPE